MYCIIVYDVAQKRVSKICKFLREYLFWIQNSVFEGEIRESSLLKIKIGIKKIINPKHDSVVIFTFQRPKWIKKEVLGKEKEKVSQLV